MNRLLRSSLLSFSILAVSFTGWAQNRDAYLAGIQGCLDRNNKACAIVAIKKCIEVFPDDPDNARLYAQLGGYYEDLNQVPKALEIYEEGLSQFETDPYLLSSKASALSAMGYFSEAVDLYSEVLKNDPGNRPARLGRAEMYINAHELDPAINDLEYLLRKDGGSDPGVIRLLAEVELEKDNFDEAMNYCNQLIVAEPQNSVAYEQRARIFAEKGNPAAGLIDINRSIELDKERVSPYLTKGKLLEALDRNSEICGVAKQAMKNNIAEASLGNLMVHCP